MKPTLYKWVSKQINNDQVNSHGKGALESKLILTFITTGINGDEVSGLTKLFILIMYSFIHGCRTL